MAIPDLNTHLEYAVFLRRQDDRDVDEKLQACVTKLLEVGTCFAVIGSEYEIRTTERGANALEEVL